MTTFERIKFLADRQKKSLNKVEEDLGYGKNVLYRLKTTSPSAERLQELANYFDVSVDYLLGRTDNQSIPNGVHQVKPKVKILSRKMENLDDSQLDALDGLIDQFFDKKFDKGSDDN